LDVFKSDVSPDCATLASRVAQCAPSVGQELRFLHVAGEAETGQEILRVVDGVPLEIAAEYLLFLRWHAPLGDYVVTYGANGVFKLRDGVVQVSADWVESEHRGKAVATLREGCTTRGRSDDAGERLPAVADNGSTSLSPFVRKYLQSSRLLQ
jgi:hypothetical protein